MDLGIWLFICFGIGFGFSILFSRNGHRWGFTDDPVERSSHRIPIPKGGGFGIVVVLAIGAIGTNMSWTLWVPACLVALVCFWGDRREVPYKIRLTIQGVAALLVSGSLLMNGQMAGVKGFGLILWIVVGAIFITATANYYNFMDGINGIAAITGMIAFAAIGVYGLVNHGARFWVNVAWSVAAACLGFLPLNFPRAKVFMGDVGSVLLGFLFASAALGLSASLKEFIILASFLFPFYADEISTLAIRIKDGDNITRPHRRHIYQILVNQGGWSHPRATLIYAALQLIVILLLWLSKGMGLIFIVCLLAFFFILYFIFGLFVRFRLEGRPNDA